MKQLMRKCFKTPGLSSAFFMIALFIVAGIINPSFLSLDNLQLCINGSVMYMLLAIGIAFVLMTGEIDVSIGSILGLSAAFMATCVRDGVSLWIAIPCTLAIGAISGLLNGYGVAKLHVSSIIMTLGTMGILRGTVYIYTKGKWVENLPDYFKRYTQASVLGFVNVFLLVTIVITLGIHFYMTKTKKGRYLAAIGDNINGANLIGIPVARTQIFAFVISGVFASLAGIIFVSKVGFVPPTAGSGYEMKAIAACVIGGISLSGGVGSMIGAFFGAIIMSSIGRILVFLKFPSEWDNTITGILLIVIVVVDSLFRRHSAEKARKERLSARTLNEEREA